MAGRIPWWRGAVIYQVYIRSFADGNGDGLGDVDGLRSKLPYLAGLGVDAIWISPWYPSPMADGGYDVADHRDVDPRFGSITNAEALIQEAHDVGLRVLLDLVPNHTSDQHPWFQAALARGRGSSERERYVFRPGRAGDQPPNDWLGDFGGSAWTRVVTSDGHTADWYLHLFAPEQPDLNWAHPEVRADFEATLRFWFGRGVDGFRIDAAHGLVKQEGLPDLAGRTYPEFGSDGIIDEEADHPYWDRPEVHEIYRRWRVVADGYSEPRVFVAEACVPHMERLARYVRGDQLHTAFNFEFLFTPWIAARLRSTIDRTLAEHAAVGAPATWVLSNHDVARHLSRYARPQTRLRGASLDDLLVLPSDPVAGIRRARAAALLMLALPGGACVYQGEELGLPEVEDLAGDVLADPIWERSAHRRRGRDGCRVPLPWRGEEPPFGFSPDGSSATPWLPQPSAWREHSVEQLDGDPDSMLALYRAALLLRRTHPALGDGTLRWLDHALDEVLMFARDPGFICLLNLGQAPVSAPVRSTLLLASGPLIALGEIPPDTAAWFESAG